MAGRRGGAALRSEAGLGEMAAREGGQAGGKGATRAKPPRGDDSCGLLRPVARGGGHGARPQHRPGVQLVNQSKVR